MASASVSASSARTRVSTGYNRLDEALQGGFLAGSAIVLSAPASDEAPLLVKSFLAQEKDAGLLFCRSLTAAQSISYDETNNVKCLVCSDKPVPPAKNIIPGKSIENLTELNLQTTETVTSLQPKRVAIDILSDVLLRHKALQTRKWLNELLERLRAKGITTLALINPNMHSREEAEAVLDIFEGSLEIVEKEVEGSLRKFLRIKWMHGIEISENEFPLEGLSRESTQVLVEAPRVPGFREPRWLAPLVGRSDELAKLKGAFDEAMNGRSMLVALEGEAGSGKTRLASELSVYAQKKQAAVLTGRASEDKLPYAPWVGVCREYISRVPGEWLRKMLGSSLPEFARLVPDITAKVGTVPPSNPLGEQQDRIRLFEAVSQFLMTISEQGSGLLIIFDDMHLADQASIDLLDYFVRSVGDRRISPVCCYPSGEAGPDTTLYKALMKLNKERLLETVTLRKFEKDETKELIREIFGDRDVSPEFADMIHQRTAGNPFFVEEVLRALVENGTIFRTEQGRWDRKPIQEIVMPESVKSALKARVGKLSQEALNALTMAAVIGSEFDFAVLREITQKQEEELLDSLEACVVEGFLLEVAGRKDVFKFVDPRIRELLLDGLLQSRRARYHVRIAEAMEKLYATNLERQADAIATHFYKGGDTERSIKYSTTAGNRSKAIHAYEQAIIYYRRALDLIDLEERGDYGVKASVLEELGHCYRYNGQLQDSSLCYDQAVVLFEKLHDSRACARVYLGMNETIFGAKGYSGVPEMIENLKRGLKYFENEQESYDAAFFYAQLANQYAVLDQWDEGIAWNDKALELGEKAKNPSAISVALLNKGTYLLDTGKVDEGLPIAIRSLDVAIQNERFDEAIQAALNLSMYTTLRSISKAREYGLRFLELSKQVNDIRREAQALTHLMIADWYAGNWSSATEEAKRSLEIQERLGVRTPFYIGTKSRLSMALGDLGQAESELQRLLILVEENPKTTEIVLANLGMAVLREEQDRSDEARKHLETCTDAFKQWEFSTWALLHVETLLRLTRIAVGQRDLEKAELTVGWVKRLAEQLGGDPALAMAFQAEAAFLSAENDAAAIDAYKKSLGYWEKAGWPYYRAKALIEYAETLAKTSPDESRKRLEEAIEIFKKLGAKRDLERAEAKISARV